MSSSTKQEEHNVSLSSAKDRATATRSMYRHTENFTNFGHVVFVRPFVKRFALSYRTVDLSVCDVGVLWPNGWTDQDETWHAGRPQPRPDCVSWGSSSPPHTKGAQQPLHWKFTGACFACVRITAVHVYCGQTAGWINMPLSMEVGLGPGHIVLDLSLIHIWRCRRSTLCRSRWSPYH